MEEQHRPASDPACTVEQHDQEHHNHNSQSQPQGHQQTQTSISRRTTTPTLHVSTGSPTQDPLSTSEPTLRFPRPLGNRQLANWISSSNPNIMHLTTTSTEDSGLSESTYELISNTDSETWSQDGNDINESIGSLDIHRPDDVQSLAGTEQMTDDDQDASASQQAAEDSDDEGAEHNKSNLAQRDEGSESDDEAGAHSRSSIEYADQSLKTPSLMTPEASNIYEKPEEASTATITPLSLTDTKDGGEKPEELRERGSWSVYAPGTSRPGINEFRDACSRVQQYIVNRIWVLGPAFIMAVVCMSLPYFLSASQQQNGVQVLSTAKTTTSLAAYSTASSTKAHTSTDAPSSLSTTSSGGLIPLEDDWVFGSKKPEVSFKTESQSSIVALVSEAVKNNWLAKDCVTITATRDGQNIETTMSSTKDGILIQFPRREAHGVVEVALRTTCKPKIQKLVKVHFGKGILEEAFEITKNLAHDLSELVPAAAHEAERRFGDAKRSWLSVSDAFGGHVMPWVENAYDCFREALNEAYSSWKSNQGDVFDVIGETAVTVSRNVREVTHDAVQHLPYMEDVQNLLHLALVDAQVHAKVWWLMVSGRQELGREYASKARDFLKKKRSAATQIHDARNKASDSTGPVSQLWSWFSNDGPKCKSKLKSKPRKLNTVFRDW